jgi:hypothetical protein
MGKWGIWMEKTKEEGKGKKEEKKEGLFICAVIFLISAITIGCGGYVDNNGNIVESSDAEQDSIFYQNKELTQFDIDVYQYFKKHKRDYADMVSFRKDLPGRVILIIDEGSPITPWDILDFKINREDGRLELEIVDKNKSGEIKLREGDILIGWVDRFYVRSGDKLPQEYIRWVSFMGRVTGIVKDESKRTLLVYAAPEDMWNVVERVALDNVVIDWGTVLEEAASPQAPVFRVVRVSSPLEAKSFEGQKRIFLKFNSIDECVSYVRQARFTFLPPLINFSVTPSFDIDFELKMLKEEEGNEYKNKKKEISLLINPKYVGVRRGLLQAGYNWLNNEMGGRLANIKDSIAVDALRSVLLKEFSFYLTLGFKGNIEKEFGIKSGGELTYRSGGNVRHTYFDAQLECVRFDWGFIPPRLTYVAIGKELSGSKWDLTYPEVDIEWEGAFGPDVNVVDKLKKPSRLLTIALYKLFRLARGVVPLYPYLDAKFIVAPGLYTTINFLSPKIKLNTAFKLMGDKTVTYKEYYRILNIRNIATGATGVIRNLISLRYKDCKQFDDRVLRSSEYLNKLSDWGGGSGSCEEVDKAVSQPSGIYFDGKGSLDLEALFGFGTGFVLLLGKEQSFLGRNSLWVGGDAFLGFGLALQAGFGGDTSGSFTMKGLRFDKMAASAYARGGFNISLFGGVIFFSMLLDEIIYKVHKSWLLYDFFTAAGGVENGKKLDPKEVEEWVREESKEAALEMLTDDEFILELLK